MKRHASNRWLACTLALSAAALAPDANAKAQEASTAVEVRGGTAAFDATTNVSAISVHGKSAALAGRARVRAAGGNLVIEQLEATLPVKTLNTGMGLRDGHMRKHVFTTPEGQVPDLRFSSNSADCSGSESQRSCELSGELAVRGTPRPFTIVLKVTKESGGALRAVGDGIVKLSTYGIPPPSQLGVKVEDSVKLHLDFVARPAPNTVATRGVE